MGLLVLVGYIGMYVWMEIFGVVRWRSLQNIVYSVGTYVFRGQSCIIRI